MPFDDILTDGASATPEVSKTFLRHALNVWARENGVAEDHLAGLVHQILDFAQDSIRDVSRLDA
ncbi:hypothetical protein [uncultured Caulobacter sp.]|uniref:hypothetical protein n=1 Tax=uncultured Caulobacter sp. TaxID=158749 RepID=UPI00261DD06B|nr:hypothetical protein [uncultured Caulobacter sp.]